MQNGDNCHNQDKTGYRSVDEIRGLIVNYIYTQIEPNSSQRRQRSGKLLLSKENNPDYSLKEKTIPELCE